MKKFLLTLLGVSVIFAFIACNNANANKPEEVEESTSSTESTKVVNPNKGVYGLLTGIVVDSYTAAPVEGVTVTIEGTNYKTVTGADGAYYFNKVPVGTYKIGYSKDGFRAQVSDEVEVVATQFLDDDPFYKKTVIDALLTLAGNAQEWESAKLDNGTLGSSTITKDDANQTSEAVSNTTSGTGKTEKNTFDFEWFVENIDNYEYYYGISLTTAKLVKLGATVKGKLVGYIEHGNAENYETGATGTGYSQEITRGTTTPLANVTVYAKVVDSGNSSDAELDGDVWKTTSDSSGNFEFKNLPVGTIMKIGFTAFDKEIEGVKYSFLNSNVEYRDSEDVNATEATFVTLDATVYETVNNVEKVVVDNVLDISSIYVKGIAPSPYVVNTNGVAKGEANPNVGTGFSTPIAVTDAITVTFNMEMDPTEFVAFYCTDVPDETTTTGEQMIAEWSEDKKTVSLKRIMNQVFPYTSASDDTYAPVAYVYFNNATAKAHTASGFEVIAIHTIKGIALAKENAVTYIAADKVPSRDLALDELDTLPFLGAVKLTFTKNIDTTAANKFKAYIKTRLTGNFKEIELADSDIIYGKDADAKSVYIKVKGLEKASVAKVEYKVFSTDPEDSIDNLGAADDDAIIFRTSDALTLVSTNLYGDDNNIYYNSLSTGDFGTNVFKLTEDIKLTFKTDIPTGATIKAELYKKDDIAAESTIGGIKGYNIVTGTPTVAGKVITIKHEPLELNTEYVFGVKVINSDGFVCFNTKSSVWAQLFTVNKTIDESGNEVDSDGLISNVALTIDNAEAKDADSFYIWFKTAATAELKLKEVDAYDYPYAYQTTKESVEYKLLAGTEDIVLTFEDEPYGAIPADDDCYKVSIVAAKADDLDAKNLITSIAIDTDERTLTISHEDFDELSTYYLSLEVFADNTLTDENKIFTTVGGTFAGKEKAKLDGNFITIKTAEANWQLVKANVYNYGTDDKYLGLDSVASITGIEAEVVFQADSAIVLTFNKNISIEDKDVTVVLYSEDYAPTDKEVSGLTAKNIAEDSIPCTFTVTGSELTITPVDETGATVEFEAGKAYWLYVAVTAKEDDTFFYFKTSEVATDKAAYAIEENVFFENADAEDDDDMIGFEVYKEPNKVFVLSDTNLVSFDDDDNIYYAVNSTTASTAIDFGVSTPITLTFTEPLPTGAVVTAELYPVNVIGGYENNPVELLKRNVVTGNPTISGATVTVNHSALIPATDYAFAVKVTADGYDDFYTKALDTITCEPQLRDDDNSEYYLIANTHIDAAVDGSYYLVFNTADGFTALEGEDYATNIALDGTTADFPATGEDIVIEVNKDISSATNDIKVYWGETKAIAEAKTRETGLSATTPVADKNGTTSVITISNSATLVPAYFYNVVIDSDDEVLSYVFQVSNEKVKGTEGTSHFTINDASSVDSSTDKVNVDFSPAGNNYGLTKMYRFFYEYGVYDTTASDYVFSNDVADWIPVNGTSGALMIDNPNYLAQRYSNYTDEYELSFDKGKETTTGRELPWIQFENNAIKFIEQYIGTNGFLYYKDVQSGIIKDVVLVEPTITNTSSLTTTSTNVTSASYRVTSNEIMEIQNVTLLGQFVGGQYTITYDATYKAATITITVSSAIDAAVGDGITVTITDLANNTPVNKTRVLE